MIFRKRFPKHCLIVEDPRFQSPYEKTKSRNRKRTATKCFFAIFVLITISLFAAELAQANSDSESVVNSLNEAESGQLLFSSGQGTFHQAVHLKTTADIQISGMVAKVSYKQVFKNDSNDWREAVYVFPLAEDAAVNEMEMRIGDRLIRAKIKEKSEAKKIYEKAKSQGKKAALTEQQRPNLFTQKVANIAPGEEIEIKLGYLQQIGYEQNSHGKGTFSFYLPTTLTPRFMPGMPLELEKELTSNSFGWAAPTDQVPDAHEISPFMLSTPELSADGNGLRNPIEINIDLKAGLKLEKITSRSHNISHDLSDEPGQKKNKSRYQINLAQGQESMDRDFWLEWTPVVGAQPEAAVFKERIDGEDYAFLMLLPPQVQADKNYDLQREVIFIIDTSGSMGGNSIQQAKASLQLALKRLTSQDKFNIIEFNSHHSSLFHTPMVASRSNRQIASNFVHKLGAGGGTNMAPALQEALRTESEEGFLKQVLFITDGAVGNEDQLFKLIQTKLGNARLFTVGIGSAPNSHFMTRAAQFGRGTFEYIANQSEITERMSNLFRKLESPVLSDLKITWPSSLDKPFSGSLDSQIEQFPQRIPDLYAGEPLELTIKLINGKRLPKNIEADIGNVVISGTVATHEGPTQWSRSLSLKGKEQHPGVGTLWARKKIAALMDEKILGRDETEVKQEVLKVAIPHKLISAYTSLVAVEERISREPSTNQEPTNPLKPGAVPNAVAKGQNQQSQSSPVNQHSYPATATWLPFNLLIGNLAMLMLLGLYRKKLGIKILKKRLQSKLARYCHFDCSEAKWRNLFSTKDLSTPAGRSR